MAREPMNKWLARALLFVGTGTAVTLSLYLHAEWGMDSRWLGVAALSAVLYGLLIHEWKDYWRYGRYWLILLGSLVVHCAMLYAARSHLREVPWPILGLLGTLEGGAISWIIITQCK